MAIAKVWNDNYLPFRQIYKGEPIEIAPKSFIEMEYDEAISFKSAPFPMASDGMGQPKPENFKMIRVDGKPDHALRIAAFKSMVDGSLHLTKEALEAHETQFSHRKIQEEVKSEPAVLKRGPGRPPKHEPEPPEAA